MARLSTKSSRKGKGYYILLLLAACLLTSCSGKHKDGPPRFHVDETRIPDAVPKIEKRAKYGNMKTYRVFGRQYHVMKSSEGYSETGVASWYGTKFHDRKTSSGEPYNMLAMTAAHKTLPLPTYVEVTNLRNKKKIIVKVNDRGPFASNRIIDLSYVAAKKLGMTGRGTAHVKIRAIDPRNFGKQRTIAKSVRRAPVESVTFGYDVYLQAGAFQNRSYAEQLQHLHRVKNYIALKSGQSKTRLLSIKLKAVY